MKRITWFFGFIVFVVFAENVLASAHCMRDDNEVCVYGTVTDHNGEALYAIISFISAANDTITSGTKSNGEFGIAVPFMTTYVEEESQQEFFLYQNYPNPFNPDTVIEYSLENESYVKLNIYNITGQMIRSLCAGHEKQGIHRITWDGRDDSGNPASSGVYLYRLEAGNFTQTRKMLLLDSGITSQSSTSAKSAPRFSSKTAKPAEIHYKVIVEKPGYETHYENDFVVSSDVEEINIDFVLVKPHINTDAYTINAEPTYRKNYPGGGGIFILSMIPKESFEGEIQLSVMADSLLNAELYTDILSLDTTASEVLVFPDSTAEVGIDTLKVIAQYSGTADTLLLRFDVEDFTEIAYTYYLKIKQECVEWLEDSYPEFGITTETEWFFYRSDIDIMIGTPAIWTHLNETWDMTIRDWYWSRWILLRKRGEAEATIAFKRVEDYAYQEIPVDEF